MLWGYNNQMSNLIISNNNNLVRKSNTWLLVMANMGNNVHDFYGKICLFRGRGPTSQNPNYALSQSEKWV